MDNDARQGQRPLDIALVGAGVCGLTCALALAKFGISVQVFEAAVRDDCSPCDRTMNFSPPHT